MTQAETQIEQDGAACPACTEPVDLTDPLLGELVDCPSCREELEVRATEPVVLAPAPEIEEDWGE